VDRFDNSLRLEVYRFFVNYGRAPVSGELASAVDATPTEVEDGLRRLADDHLVVLAPSSPYIWMAHPFSGVVTDFKVHSSGRDWYANCIWDAFGILAIVGTNGAISTHCPDCSQPLTIEVHGGELVDEDYLVHFAVPAARWWDDIGFT
jgi:hypothetical protein